MENYIQSIFFENKTDSEIIYDKDTGITSITCGFPSKLTLKIYNKKSKYVYVFECLNFQLQDLKTLNDKKILNEFDNLLKNKLLNFTVLNNTFKIICTEIPIFI